MNAPSPVIASPRPLSEPPGGVLMWIIVSLELVTFSIVFVMLAVFRASEPALFREGQQSLSPTVGLALTLALITSGALAAEAVHSFRKGRFGRSRFFYFAAIASGLVFVGLKVRDYAAHFAEGHRLGTNDFWDAYFLGTGFHFAHVLVGLALLIAVGSRVGKTRFTDEETAIAGTALFWHMCDLAWFFLFPLFFARA